MTDQEIILALRYVSNKYGIPFAKTIEQLFRNETRHFASGNFIKTYSPGMEAVVSSFPYGWSSAKDFWIENKNYTPIGIFKQVENSSAMLKSRGERKFIQFPSLEASMMTVAYIIDKRGGDGGSWFSVDNKVLRAKYNAEIAKIIPRFVNKF